jgi:hypothetical protein
MGLFDAMFGRRRVPEPNLDRLFAVPSAALTVQAAAGFSPTGEGSVCFRPAEGSSFDELQLDIAALLDSDGGPPVERSTDSFGYTWLTSRHDPADLAGLMTDLHAVTSTLEQNGFGTAVLCCLVIFRDAQGRALALIYLSKRGTFYPFAPIKGDQSGNQRRDTALELQIRGQLGVDLPLEPDVSRWFPVWQAPGLA